MIRRAILLVLATSVAFLSMTPPAWPIAFVIAPRDESSLHRSIQQTLNLRSREQPVASRPFVTAGLFGFDVAGAGSPQPVSLQSAMSHEAAKSPGYSQRQQLAEGISIIAFIVPLRDLATGIQIIESARQRQLGRSASKDVGGYADFSAGAISRPLVVIQIPMTNRSQFSVTPRNTGAAVGTSRSFGVTCPPRSFTMY